MGLITICNKIIEYSFYALFFLVPLIFTSRTSELFELNKMWITWGLAVAIISSWGIKMIAACEFRIQRTPLDIPILLFLISQIIATIFSLDQRISWWGYYSRFNGGLLSLITYILLYYAFITNLGKKEVIRSLFISLASGLLVALWGLPSHFGYDPTCLMFRGTFDVSCWTDAFKPTVRIFSTLGQPAWLAAYLSVLLPITMAFYIKLQNTNEELTQKTKLFSVGLILLAILFYADLIFTNTRAGFLGFWAANGFFWAVLYLTKALSKQLLLRSFLIFNISFVVISFFFGTTFAQLDKFTMPGIMSSFNSEEQQQELTPTTPAVGNLGGTDSGQIRLLVWEGAIAAWKANPLFGTGVETFAFAYYKHRPQEHNLTSEWDYLYNKAHNEYLNYLTTTGIVGLGSYLAIILFFLVLGLIMLKEQIKTNKKSKDKELILNTSFIASFIAILITNFFGFSVVIINLYFFLLPAFFLILRDKISSEKQLAYNFAPKTNRHEELKPFQWTLVSIIGIVGFYLLFLLLRFWQADTTYALGSNLQRAGDVQTAYVHLSDAVRSRPSEPVFQDEYAINLATLGTALIENNEATVGAQLAQEAVQRSDAIVATHPNNITYWKSRVRIFYSLSQIDPQYLGQALESIRKAHELAPTDAKVSYNLGVLYGQNGDPEKAIAILTDTISLKPDYRDAYFARALFYRELALSDESTLTNPQLQEKAAADLRYILKNLNPLDEQSKKTLESWNEAVE